MQIRIALTLAALLLGACAAEKAGEAPSDSVATTTTATAPAVPTETVASTASEPATATNENQHSGTWIGQVKVGQPASMFNYVGAESGDFAPMRFRNDSEAGKKILAACSNDDTCEFTGVVDWLDETPPPDASAIGQIVRVDSVKRLPAAL